MYTLDCCPSSFWRPRLIPCVGSFLPPKWFHHSLWLNSEGWGRSPSSRFGCSSRAKNSSPSSSTSFPDIQDPWSYFANSIEWFIRTGNTFRRAFWIIRPAQCLFPLPPISFRSLIWDLCTRGSLECILTLLLIGRREWKLKMNKLWTWVSLSLTHTHMNWLESYLSYLLAKTRNDFPFPFPFPYTQFQNKHANPASNISHLRVFVDTSIVSR